MSIPKFSRKHKIILILLSIWAIHFYLFLPSTLFNVSYSKLLFSKENKILSVKIATDEQWRIPLTDSLSEKYKTCLIYFEDESFYKHPGVNPFSLIRATYHNIMSGKTTSGGSTITMQVVRLSKQNPPRTIWEKLKEMYLTLRVECSYSKEEILNLYANHAPFGGNVVGITAAGWKYFGRPLSELSWAEAATLAVLPNSPSLIFPGKNNHLLLKKRNFLLNKLFEKGIIEATTLSLAQEEPLPSQFITFPKKAPHLLEYLAQQYPEQNIFHSSLNHHLQERSTEILNYYMADYAHNYIFNGAVLIIDNYTNQVVSYVGNSEPINHTFHENYVDLIHAPRSTGSILKPFLHAAAMDEGVILNKTILPDIPTIIQGFAPQNFTKSFEGAVHADAALSRSLNIPAVRLLQLYGYPLFHSKLQKLGITTLDNSADHYGLSLILGGAEVTMWDLAKVYSGMAKTLNHFEKAPLNKPYFQSDYNPPLLFSDSVYTPSQANNFTPFTASTVFETFETLLELKRPTEEGDWKLFDSSKKIAWKTGTSHGFRDAWAVGVTPHYTVAIWIGNATGEGRPGLVGVRRAAPILFSIFNLLPSNSWFKAPKRDMYAQAICRHSGKKASSNCFDIDTLEISKAGLQTELCNYCTSVFINKKGKQVNSSCAATSDMISKKYFVLPPVQEWYYVQKSANYEKLPPFEKHCLQSEKNRTLDFIYPNHQAKIYIPRELEGQRGQLVCEATHKNKKTTVHWHLDNEYLGATVDQHQIAIDYTKGIHTLSIIDETGEQRIIRFEVL